MYTNRHGKPCDDVPASGTVEGDGEAASPWEGDSHQASWGRTSRYTVDHGDLASTYGDQGRRKQAEELQV